MNHSNDPSVVKRTLTYECPHCHRQVQVDAALLGQAVNCPECEQPFKIDPPSGRLVTDRENQGHAPFEEAELLTTRPAMFGISPLKFFGLWILLLIGVGLCVFGLWIVGLIFISMAGLWLIGWWIDSRFQTIVVTNERTIYQRGILSTRSSEVQHDDVRNMQVNQSVFQRMIGVGDISISSAGQSDMEIQVRGFKNPHEVIEIIRRYQ